MFFVLRGRIKFVIFNWLRICDLRYKEDKMILNNKMIFIIYLKCKKNMVRKF